MGAILFRRRSNGVLFRGVAIKLISSQGKKCQSPRPIWLRAPFLYLFIPASLINHSCFQELPSSHSFFSIPHDRSQS